MEKDTRFIAIISYFSIFGWIIALILHYNGKERDPFNGFHLRQALALAILFIFSFIPFPLFGLLTFAVVILMILGIINAAKGEQKEIPFIGKFANDAFSAIQ